MFRPAAPDAALLAWLRSDEGTAWQQEHTRHVHHAAGVFAEVKNDHECPAGRCGVFFLGASADGMIFTELRRYGIAGVPEEWKARCRG